MDWERLMCKHCVDPALSVLKKVVDLPYYPPESRNLTQATYQELMLFKMFFWGMASQDVWRLRCDSHLLCDLTILMYEFSGAAKEFRKQYNFASQAEKITDWDTMLHRFKETIQPYKKSVVKLCYTVLRVDLERSVDAKSLRAGRVPVCQPVCLEDAKETASLIVLILENLQNYDSDTPSMVLFEEKLKVFGKFASIAQQSKIIADNVIYHNQTWAGCVACFAYLQWIDDMDESLASSMLSDLLRNYIPSKSLIFQVLIVAEYRASQSKLVSELVISYVDFLLEHLVITEQDDIEFFREGLTFLLTFLMDPNEEVSERKNVIVAEIYGIMSEMPSAFSILEA